jgi:hypothetical protein
MNEVERVLLAADRIGAVVVCDPVGVGGVTAGWWALAIGGLTYCNVLTEHL